MTGFVPRQALLSLQCYSPSILQLVAASAAVSGNASSITLPDNTRITFAGLSSTSQLFG